MNLPNRITVLRIGLIPLMVVLMYIPEEVCFRWAASGVFAAAALTDYLDGHLARSRNLITDLGRFLDPLADKMLVLSAMAMLVDHSLLPAWVLILILGRELAVDGLRMNAAARGTVIAAAFLGKFKTVSQIVLVLWLMLSRIPATGHWIGWVLSVAVGLLTVLSGAEYFLRNRGALSGG